MPSLARTIRPQNNLIGFINNIISCVNVNQNSNWENQSSSSPLTKASLFRFRQVNAFWVVSLFGFFIPSNFLNAVFVSKLSAFELSIISIIIALKNAVDCRVQMGYIICQWQVGSPQSYASYKNLFFHHISSVLKPSLKMVQLWKLSTFHQNRILKFRLHIFFLPTILCNGLWNGFSPQQLIRKGDRNGAEGIITTQNCRL